MADSFVQRGARPPNPPFVNASRVARLSIDTGPLPDVEPTPLISCGCVSEYRCRHRRYRRSHRR